MIGDQPRWRVEMAFRLVEVRRVCDRWRPERTGRDTGHVALWMDVPICSAMQVAQRF